MHKVLLISKFQNPAGSIDWTNPKPVGGWSWKDSEFIPEKDKQAILLQLDVEERDKKIVVPLKAPTNKAQWVKNNYAAKQKALHKLGLYNKTIDGIWGSGSKAGEKAALALGYLWDEKLQNYIKQSPLLINKTTTLEPESTLQELVRLTGNANDFGQYAYKLGTNTWHSLGNILTTAIPYAKTLFGSTSSADYHSDGTDKQLIGMAYGGGRRPADADERLLKGETLRYFIGKDANGNYDWLKINGGLDVSSGNPWSAAVASGSHTIGQAAIEETLDGIRIIDNYDFNNRGESGARVDNGTANWYDYIRAAAPNKQDNPEYTGLSVNWFIPRDSINKLITSFNAGK